MTDEKNFVILQHNKAVEFITQKQAEDITEAMAQGARGIKRGSIGWLAFSSISDILPLETYYQKYPEKRPETPTAFNEYYGGSKEYTPIERTAEQHKDQFRGVLKGLKQYIDEQLAKGINPRSSIHLYETKLAKFKQEFAPKVNLEAK
jgi:hypothetical protein